MSRHRILDQIRTLDPQKDHQRIVYLSTCFDFAFDNTRALEFALFRTFCVPAIAGLLERTGESPTEPKSATTIRTSLSAS